MGFTDNTSSKKQNKQTKNLPSNAEDIRNAGLIPGLGRSSQGGHGNSLQYSYLRIPWTENLPGYCPWGYKESDMTEVI